MLIVWTILIPLVKVGAIKMTQPFVKFLDAFILGLLPWIVPVHSEPMEKVVVMGILALQHSLYAEFVLKAGIYQLILNGIPFTRLWVVYPMRCKRIIGGQVPLTHMGSLRFLLALTTMVILEAGMLTFGLPLSTIAMPPTAGT